MGCLSTVLTPLPFLYSQVCCWSVSAATVSVEQTWGRKLVGCNRWDCRFFLEFHSLFFFSFRSIFSIISEYTIHSATTTTITTTAITSTTSVTISTTTTIAPSRRQASPLRLYPVAAHSALILPQGRVLPQQEPTRSGWVVLGQDQDRPGGGYQADQSFRGRLARVRLWSRRLSPLEVAGVVRCDATLDAGAVLAWPAATPWRLNDTAHVVQVPRQDLCRPKGPYLVLLSPPMLLSRARDLCNALDSHIATPTSTAETEEFLRLTGDTCSGGPQLWLGASDADHEGHWVDEAGRGVAYTNWIVGQPNGMTGEDRAVMTKDGKWMDLSSAGFYNYCAICSTKSGLPLLVRLRGLCSNLQHDTRYIQEGHVLAKPFFRGFSVSNISWDGERWLAMHQAR